MDKHLCFARTEKGREELLGTDRTLKARARQVLFLVGDTISVAELKQKLPTCQELEKILEQLWQHGFIGAVQPDGSARPTAQGGPAVSPIEAARELALRALAGLAGESSPVYAQIRNAAEPAAFLDAVAAAKKILATSASAAQASGFEQSVLALLRSPQAGEAGGGSAQLRDMGSAKSRALEIISALVGVRSPVYIKVTEAYQPGELVEAVAAAKKVISAVASASHGQAFESEVLGLLKQT